MRWEIDQFSRELVRAIHWATELVWDAAQARAVTRKALWRSLMIPFAGNPLNRASEKRTDASWIEAKRRDPTSRILPIWRLEPFLLEPESPAAPTRLGFLRPDAADGLAGKDAPCIFLGLDGERAVFAIDISAGGEAVKGGALGRLGYFQEARTAAQTVSIQDGAIIAQAKALIDWHQRHGFCPRRGAPTKIMDAG